MPTSLDTYYPFDAGAGAGIPTEAAWRNMARFWFGTGPIRGEDNELQVYADSSGDQVKVKTGKAYVRGHYGENTSEKTIALTAGHLTLARIDRIVLRADFTNNRIELDKLTGTASGSPAAPALTQSAAMWEISLAQISVPATDTVIDAGQVTDERTLIAPPDLAWTAYTPVLQGNGGNPTLGTGGVAAGRWQRTAGRLVRVEFEILFGTAAIGVGVGNYSVTLPTPARALLVVGGLATVPVGIAALRDASVPTIYPVHVELGTTSAAFLRRCSDGTLLSATNPVVPAINDDYVGSFVYEAAA